MKKLIGRVYKIFAVIVSSVLILSACYRDERMADDTLPQGFLPTQTAQPNLKIDLPEVVSVSVGGDDVSKYESVEMTLEIDAKYSNPYDTREVEVNGVFQIPGGGQWVVPGFWDGDGDWKIRFTPSKEGSWKYSIFVKDSRGTSNTYEGFLAVGPSDLHGWIIPGNSFDPSYSSHYLVYHDGTPFYGVGYCEALNILIDGFDAEDGVGLFDNMKAANANYVVWWPMYTNSIVGSSYDNYSVGNMKVIDAVVKDAEKEGIVLVFTIWDHPNLRDETHAWGEGNWTRNGFSKLGDIDSFFVSDEAWAWQENMYRYIIARWGYSTSIGMWQTVSEVNGTNAYDQTDPWHEKVNNYFVENDPYRHPTTASGSGEVDWQTGHTIMDMPQVHLYDFNNNASQPDAVGAAKHIADWTHLMLKNADRPNWVGEFGVTGNAYYPELFHNSIWAALASGAAMTPAEWNSGGSWGRMTPEMNADLSRLTDFVSDLPLAQWNPSAVQVAATDEQLRGWGIAGQGGGLIWIQDYSLEGASVGDLRNLMFVRSGVQVEVIGLPAGIYEVATYDTNTKQGVYLNSFDLECISNAACEITLPDFKSDIAIRLIIK